MTERYRVDYAGPRTRIIECGNGEWPRWDMARVAAIEHVEDVLAEAQAALDTLRRSGNMFEYTLRRKAFGREQESQNVRLVLQEDAEDFLKAGRPPVDVGK